MSERSEIFQTAIWIGASLFARGKATGSSANMSFRLGDHIYITGSGTCFGTLNEDSFSKVDMQGNHIDGICPSKELLLHLNLYEKSKEIGAVIHTHSFYATLWSCLSHECQTDCIPSYTPYLKMKLGTVGIVPYAKPGSPELFRAFAERLYCSEGYLLANHGPIVGGKDLMSAFYALEELEESARVAWGLRNQLVEVIS